MAREGLPLEGKKEVGGWSRGVSRGGGQRPQTGKKMGARKKKVMGNSGKCKNLSLSTAKEKEKIRKKGGCSRLWGKKVGPLPFGSLKKKKREKKHLKKTYPNQNRRTPWVPKGAEGRPRRKELLREGVDLLTLA